MDTLACRAVSAADVYMRCKASRASLSSLSAAVSQRRIFAAQVHLCELIRDDDAASEGDLLSTSRTTYVAVRLFNRDLNISARYWSEWSPSAFSTFSDNLYLPSTGRACKNKARFPLTELTARVNGPS